MSTLEKRVFEETCDRCRAEFVAEAEVDEDGGTARVVKLQELKVSIHRNAHDRWTESKEVCHDCAERFQILFQKFMEREP